MGGKKERTTYLLLWKDIFVVSISKARLGLDRRCWILVRGMFRNMIPYRSLLSLSKVPGKDCEAILNGMKSKILSHVSNQVIGS